MLLPGGDVAVVALNEAQYEADKEEQNGRIVGRHPKVAHASQDLRRERFARARVELYCVEVWHC